MLLHFDDSEIAHLSAPTAGNLCIHFAAARLDMPHPTRLGRIAGYAPLQLECLNVQHVSCDGWAVGRLHDGHLHMGPNRWRTLPVPWQMSGQLVVELIDAYGTHCHIECTHVRIHAPAQTDITESLMC